jgi:hypothetical protein
LMQLVGGRGIDRTKLDLALEQLILERRVGRSSMPGTGGLVYTWIANEKHRLPKTVPDNE